MFYINVFKLGRLGLKVDRLAQENGEYMADMLDAEYQSKDDDTDWKRKISRRISRVGDISMVSGG